MTVNYNQRLMKVCKKGHLNKGFALLDEMMQNKIELSHYNFSALIHGAIKSNQPQRYKSIWNDFINKYEIKPNYITYSLAISAASRCNEIETVKQFRKELEINYELQMDNKTYNELINSFARIHHIEDMLDIYNKMKLLEIVDCCTISCLLSGCVKSMFTFCFFVIFCYA